MNTFLATQFILLGQHDRYYTKSAFASILRRYARAFGPVTLCVPFREEAPAPVFEDVTECVKSVISVTRNQAFFHQKDKEITKALGEADLVILRCHSFVSFRAGDLARKLGKPILAEAMACPWDAMWNHGILGKLLAPWMYWKMRQTFRRADYALYVTEQFLQHRYPCPGHQISASNVALAPVCEALPVCRPAPDREQLILMTAAAVDVAFKGQECVIRAIPALNARGIRVRYICAGQGDPTRLQRIAARLGVGDQVDFPGVLSHRDIFAALDQCHIYLQPSLQEGLPRALIEAMSRGCPCIGARTAGIPELLAPQWIVPKGSSRAIAEKIMELLSSDIPGISSENLERSKRFAPEILDARRSAFFARIRQELGL